jgi:hypothetical protein
LLLLRLVGFLGCHDVDVTVVFGGEMAPDFGGMMDRIWFFLTGLLFIESNLLNIFADLTDR